MRFVKLLILIFIAVCTLAGNAQNVEQGMRLGYLTIAQHWASDDDA